MARTGNKWVVDIEERGKDIQRNENTENFWKVNQVKGYQVLLASEV